MIDHEELECDHLAKFFDHFSVDCVFDVGANAGQYARLIRHRVGFTGPIVSFEPVPYLCNVLREQAAADPNWHILELALDRTAREATFNVMAADQFSSLKTPRHDEIGMFKEMNKISEEIKVNTSTLGVQLKLLENKFHFERPFLKLDTQGNDLDIVEGAGDAIRKFIGIQSELSIRQIYNDVSYFDEVLRRYREKGFNISAFVPNNKGHFPDLIEIDCIMYRS